MDINTITQLVTSVGFPIVACYVLFKQNSELTNTITKLTVTLETINERIGKIEKRLDNDKKEE